MKYVDWFVYYTEIDSSMRTTNHKLFTRLKDAREFSINKRGYIVRLESEDGFSNQGNSKLYEYFGNFEPSATEQLYIDKIINTEN